MRMEKITMKHVFWIHIHTYFDQLSCTVISYAAWAVKSILKATVTKNVYFRYDIFYYVKPVQYILHITFWQAMGGVATSLFMVDTSFLQTLKSKWAVIFGTLIGFIMINIIIIITTILKNPLHRAVVCNKFVFWHSFASQPIVLTQLSLATEHISDTIVTYLIVFSL